MAELQVTLTAEERQYLLNLLQATLRDKRIKEHRTRTPTYREHVLQEEAIAEGLVNKLGLVPG